MTLNAIYIQVDVWKRISNEAKGNTCMNNTKDLVNNANNKMYLVILVWFWRRCGQIDNKPTIHSIKYSLFICKMVFNLEFFWHLILAQILSWVDLFFFSSLSCGCLKDLKPFFELLLVELNLFLNSIIQKAFFWDFFFTIEHSNSLELSIALFVVRMESAASNVAKLKFNWCTCLIRWIEILINVMLVQKCGCERTGKHLFRSSYPCVHVVSLLVTIF